MVLALYRRLEDEGLTEPELVGRLTHDYGGEVLPNARIIHELDEAEAERAFGEMKRRLDNIDKVAPKEVPRNPPSPHPDFDTKTRLARPTGTVVEGRPLPTPMYTEFPPAHDVLHTHCGEAKQPGKGVILEVRPSCTELPNRTSGATAGSDLLSVDSVPQPCAPSSCLAGPGPAALPRDVFPDPLFRASPVNAVPPIASGTPMGENQYYHMPAAQNPIPGGTATPLAGGGSHTSLLTSLVYHVDRMANPDTSTKAGTLENVRRNEEILVYVARFFDNNTVALCPGAFGKQLSVGLKSLNEKLRPLYDQYRIPCGFSNRFCIASAFLYRGGRDKEEGYYLTESEFSTWPTRDFDRYTAPAGWSAWPRPRASQHIETWKINAVNMSRMFAAVYGAELLQERLGAIDYLRSLHVYYPRNILFHS